MSAPLATLAALWALTPNRIANRTIPPSHAASTEYPIFLPLLRPFRGAAEPPGAGASIALTAPSSAAAGRSAA